MGFWLSSTVHVLVAANAALVPVKGVVRDAGSGLPLAQAIVSLPDLSQTVFTDEQGRYFFEAPAGAQNVSVQRFGYQPQAFEALVPSQGTLEINIALRREPFLLPPIEVRAPVSIRGLGAASPPLDFPDRSMSQAALYQHPLLSEPDALRALGGGEVSVDPESPSGLHIRGGASDQVGYVLDGIPVFSPYRTGGSFSAWNPDALSSIDLIAASPLHSAPEALSGVVAANTRTPGARFQSRGSVSATQARATVDGPLGGTGAGYLLSVSSAFPGLMLHKNEPSHMNGENRDVMGKLDAPLLGGRMRVVGFDSRNDIDVAAFTESSENTLTDRSRNTLAWDGRSLGGEWSRALGGDAAFTLRAWSAAGDVRTAWAGADSLERLDSRRRDDGAVAMVETGAGGGRATVGARTQIVETRYALEPSTPGGREYHLSGRTPITTAFVEYERPLGDRVEIDASLASAFALGDVHASPSAQLRWRTTRTLLVSGTATRRQQFGQSLRNPESVVSNIFPVDLYVVAGAAGVPVATSDMGILALEHRPNAWLRFGAQAFLRDFDALALVAPRSADPYAVDGFVAGSGSAHGFALEAAAGRERVGVLANYAYQRVALRYPDGEYAPNYSAAHSIQVGMVLSPSSSYSVRIGFEGLWGRRSTATLGSFEWEACNLVDGGCEFAGSPSQWSGALGGTELPAYFRLDVGIRRQWDVTIGGRQGRVALFGTATNLLARKNVLTVSENPSTGARSDIEMVPASPVAVGLDWRF